MPASQHEQAHRAWGCGAVRWMIATPWRREGMGKNEIFEGERGGEGKRTKKTRMRPTPKPMKMGMVKYT